MCKTVFSFNIVMINDYQSNDFPIPEAKVTNKMKINKKIDDNSEDRTIENAFGIITDIVRKKVYSNITKDNQLKFLETIIQKKDEEVDCNVIKSDQFPQN
jgi:hypothetical protein